MNVKAGIMPEYAGKRGDVERFVEQEISRLWTVFEESYVDLFGILPPVPCVDLDSFSAVMLGYVGER